MEVEMSQSPVTHLEIDDEDILLVSEEASPIPRRKLKRLKRAGQALGNDRRQVPLTDQNKIAHESDPMEYVNANEFVSNGQGFTASLEQIEHAEEQCISQNKFCNLLGEANKQDDQKDHQVDNVHIGTDMLEAINTSMDISAPESGKDCENLKVHAYINEHTREETEDSQVSNNHTEMESLKAKNKSRKSTHEEDNQSKKLKKNPVSKDESIAEASDDFLIAASCSLEKKKKKKKKKEGSQGKSKISSESLNTVEKKSDKKKKKSNIEEIHAESQRLLRETPNASFKPQATVGKSISSVLEKIRLRKLQLEQKAGKGSSGVLQSSEDDTSSEDLSEESHHTSLSDGDEEEDERLKEMPQTEVKNEEGNSEDVSFRNSLANESGIPRTPDNHGETSLCEKGTRQDNCKTNGVFRAPVEDTQDLFCNSDLSVGDDEEENPDDSTQENEICVSTLSNMNLKLDSHPDDDELFDEDENKENVDPSSSKPVETSVYSKGVSVKAFVDDEAEDEDEDILVRHDEDNSEEDENEDLKDLVATAEEEQPVDQWKRDELHRKWLEEQDAAETGDILQRLGCGWRQKAVRKPALLGEDDDVAFDDDEDDIVECDDKLGHHNLVSEESEHGDDDYNMEAQPLKPTVDEDDVYESSDDEELEERLMRQRVLEDSEEQEVFLSPADDETSREVFGLIKKVNVAPTVKKKPKPSSTFHEIFGSGGNSNSSSKSSFLGRTTNSSIQISHKQGPGSSRFYIFGRDDSNSAHAISKSESQEDLDQKENKYSADNLNKMSLTQNKAKQNESGSKTANNKTDSSMASSLFQILRRQTSEIDRTLQSRNTNGDNENKQAYSISHFAAFKSFRSVKTIKKTE